MVTTFPERGSPTEEKVMANRRYDEPRRFEGHGLSREELERLRRGPREDMRPGSRAEWDQNLDDYARAQEAVRTRGRSDYRRLREEARRIGRSSRSGREYALNEGPFYDELREEREHGIGYGGMHERTGPERGRYRYGTRGLGEVDTPDVRERIHRETLRREQREPHAYSARYGPVYGHGPGVENMEPPSIGYSTSRSRQDDHESGHGGFIGGGVERRSMAERPRGRGPRGYTRSDARIREDICERLMDSWMDVEHVEVRVDNGEVSLVGAVRSRDEKHAIENVAASVLGVKEVHNSLLVERGAIRVDPDMRRPVEPTDDTLHS